LLYAILSGCNINSIFTHLTSSFCLPPSSLQLYGGQVKPKQPVLSLSKESKKSRLLKEIFVRFALKTVAVSYHSMLFSSCVGMQFRSIHDLSLLVLTWFQNATTIFIFIRTNLLQNMVH